MKSCVLSNLNKYSAKRMKYKRKKREKLKVKTEENNSHSR